MRGFWCAACSLSRVTLPQIAAQSSLPVSALAAAPLIVRTGKHLFPGAAKSGNSFQELVARMAAGTNSAGSKSGSNQPLKTAGSEATPINKVVSNKPASAEAASQDVAPSEAASSSPAAASTTKNALAQLLAANSNAALGSHFSAIPDTGPAAPVPGRAKKVVADATDLNIVKGSPTKGSAIGAEPLDISVNGTAQNANAGTTAVVSTYGSLPATIAQQTKACAIAGAVAKQTAQKTVENTVESNVENNTENNAAPLPSAPDGVGQARGTNTGQTSDAAAGQPGSKSENPKNPVSDVQAQRVTAQRNPPILLSGEAILPAPDEMVTTASNCAKAGDAKPNDSPATAPKSEREPGSSASTSKDAAFHSNRKDSQNLSTWPLAEMARQLLQSSPLSPPLTAPPAPNAANGAGNTGKTSTPGASGSRNIVAVSPGAASAPSAAGALATPLSADAPVVQPEHLAFALAASTSQDSNGATPQTASPVQPAADVQTTKGANRAPVSSTVVAASSAQAGFAAPVWQTGVNGMDTTSVPQPHANAAAQSPAALPEAHEISKPATLRTLRVQLVGDNNQRVDVRMGDTGGQLRVSVRSTDAVLTQTLQDRMPELTARLGDQHFHTEVWMPSFGTNGQSGTSAAANTGATGGRPAGNSFAGGNPNGQGQGQPGGRQQNGQNQYKPAWVDDFLVNPRRIQTTRRG